MPVRQALRQAQLALSGGAAFDPATEEHIFRIAMTPEIEMLLVPELTARLRRHAPGIKVLTRIFSYNGGEPTLEDGSIDLSVGCTSVKTSRRQFEALYDVEVSCCFNPNLLKLSNPISLEQFLSADHAVISQSDSLQGCIKEALEMVNIELNVVTAATTFMPVLSAAAASPIIATLPTKIAQRYAPLLGLDISPIPVTLNFPPVNMVWAAHADADPVNAWLRQQVRECLSCPDIACAA